MYVVVVLCNMWLVKNHYSDQTFLSNSSTSIAPKCTLPIFFTCLMPDDFTCKWGSSATKWVNQKIWQTISPVNSLTGIAPQCGLLVFFTCLTPDHFTCKWRSSTTKWIKNVLEDDQPLPRPLPNVEFLFIAKVVSQSYDTLAACNQLPTLAKVWIFSC